MYADDLESDFKRALLASLKASLPAVLPMLTSALEQHFGQALAAAQGGGKEAATAHAAVVTAALGESGYFYAHTSPAIAFVLLGVLVLTLLQMHAAATPHLSAYAACGAGALATFVPWAPLQPLADAGAITACAFLLNTSEFRLTACGILRDVISRKQQQAS